MGILKNLFSKKQEAKAQPPQEEPKRPKGIIKTQRHKLENVEAHMKEIMELVEENEDYKLSKKALIEDGRENEKIYQYELSEKAKLLFGGGGGAIQVFVDDVHIGDIKKGSTARVKKLIESGNIRDVETEVSGGNYKIVRYDSGRDKYFYDSLEDAFCITIEITYREEIKEDV
ncbi:hypothetical protein [Parablautia intestinalis]|uniref:hypothetical protein n=1 Tax=Parablautia intestinalis TaxID=2320100 RepID=UPI00256F077C|nr:hypothetical protein [Parablautia intestinalis]